MHISIKRFFLTSLVSLALILTALAVTAYAQKELEVQKEEQERQAVNNRILEGATIQPVQMEVDYNKQISTGSPLVFGGNHAPKLDQQEAWDKVAEVGVTSMRKDMFVESPLPPDITLEDYKANKNDIQNPDNWSQKHIDETRGFYQNAKKRGMKTIGIVAYSPQWLNYTKSVWAVPKDLDVYEDLVKKSYKLYRDDLDYVEIWNEPNFDHFFNVEGSGMTQEEAYKGVFKHAVKAIREVDNEANDGKIIPIMGPAGYDPIKTGVLEAILDDPELKDKLDIVTYHNYDAKHLQEPSWVNYKKVLGEYGKQDLPIFITEWNYEPDSMATSPYHTTSLAITYTADKFVNFLKMGLAGASYHVIEPLYLSRPNRGEGYMGFYRWENGHAELLPQSKTWRLMSNKIGLGKGESKIYELDSGSPDVNSLGFVNSDNQHGVVFVNKQTAQMASLNLKNTGIKRYAKVTISYANADNDAIKPVYEGHVKVVDNSINLQVFIPDDTVVGMTIQEEKNWFDILDIINR